MFVVFWTDRGPNGGADGSVDHFEMVETRAKAGRRYSELLNLASTYCAGFGPCTRGTEPHWTEKQGS